MAIAETRVGRVLVFVCHEAVLFPARSMANLGDRVGIAIRDRFGRELSGDRRPRYVLIATHWQDAGPHSGGSLVNAAGTLAEQYGVTVVTTMRSPRRALEAAALRYSVCGPRAGAVATLLIEDTFPEG